MDFSRSKIGRFPSIFLLSLKKKPGCRAGAKQPSVKIFPVGQRVESPPRWANLPRACPEILIPIARESGTGGEVEGRDEAGESLSR